MGRVAFITAMYGGYEKSTKPCVKQIVPPEISIDCICFTDNVDTIINKGMWILDDVPYHKTHKMSEYEGINSTNTHPFMIAKFYKQQWHRIPRLQEYDLVIWIDGTIEITNPRTIYHLLRIDPDCLMSSWAHERHSTLAEEAVASNFDKYTSTSFFGYTQPYQDVLNQLHVYESLGFPIHKKDSVFCTCFIAFYVSQHKDDIYTFLDTWYTQTLRYTTQDQISFPYCLWKLQHKCHRWYGTPHTRTHLFVKHHHHQ
jgi:hypothetical protein